MVQVGSHVAVVVLGDLGRSPRMQYHAAALADAGADVELVGLAGSELPGALRDHPRIRAHRIVDPPRPADAYSLAAAARRALGQANALRHILRRLPPPLDLVLVQNPPAFPTLAVALLAARRRGTRLVVDWHNLAYTVLALRVGAAHPAVRLAAWYEGLIGRRADGHLCVSRAMQRALHERWGVRAVVLHDRPAPRFAPLADAPREAAVHALCSRLGVSGRPAVVVSATSWTPDEPFALLLDAAEAYERRLAAGAALPELLVVVTGDGALRAAFEENIAARPRGRVHLRTLWLPPDEYPRVLAAADLGLCLHRSSSGLDLPMKIADMFGAGLPVCALDYGPCLREVLHPGEDAVLFSTAAELADRLGELLHGFPVGTPDLDRLRATVVARGGREHWDAAWQATAAPLFRAHGKSGATDEHR